MYEAMVFMATFLLVISAFDYVRRAWIGETKPVPATWVLMMVVMSLSFWMCWNNPNKSLTSNIGVTSGIVNIAIILAGVIAANIRYGTLQVAFDRTQKQCLALGGIVVVFWFFTNQTLLSYILVQCIALIAYFATVKRLWNAKGSTELISLGLCIPRHIVCDLPSHGKAGYVFLHLLGSGSTINAWCGVPDPSSQTARITTSNLKQWRYTS